VRRVSCQTCWKQHSLTPLDIPMVTCAAQGCLHQRWACTRGSAWGIWVAGSDSAVWDLPGGTQTRHSSRPNPIAGTRGRCNGCPYRGSAQPRDSGPAIHAHPWQVDSVSAAFTSFPFMCMCVCVRVIILYVRNKERITFHVVPSPEEGEGPPVTIIC
jgi:hypothetical protein